MLGLRGAIAHAHPAGATVRTRLVAPAPATMLAAPATAGDAQIMCVNAAAVAVGDRLAIGDDDVREFTEVVAAEPATGLVVIDPPLRRSRSTSDLVRTVALGAAGVTTALVSACRAQDTSVATAADLAAPAGHCVEIVDGPAGEVVDHGAVTDAEGRYRFGRVRSAGSLTIGVTAPAHHPGSTTRRLGHLDLTIDVTLEPI